MDLDTIITIFFLVVFFILPSIFKMVVRNKKKPAADSSKKRSPVFGRIGGQIRAFLKDLERQAREQMQQEEGKEAQSVWDKLADEAPEETYEKVEEPLPVPHGLDPGYLAALREVEVSVPEPEKQRKRLHRKALAGRQTCPVRRFRSDPLQNAVVWSEILSRPVAMREE